MTIILYHVVFYNQLGRVANFSEITRLSELETVKRLKIYTVCKKSHVIFGFLV